MGRLDAADGHCDAGVMGWHDELRSDTVLAVWHVLRPPVLAVGAMLVARGLGRWLDLPWLRRSGGGAGLLVGWCALFGVPASARVLANPHALTDRVRLLALAALLAGELADWLARWTNAVALILAALVGWWMAGAPQTHQAWGREGVAAITIAVLVALLQHLALVGGTGRLILASVTLLVGLAVVGAAPLWLMLALVPAVCAGGLAGHKGAASELLPVAAGLAIAGVAVAQTAGHLLRGGFNGIDAACLAPLLTLALAPQLGRAGPRLAPALAVAIGVIFAALAARVTAWF